MLGIRQREQRESTIFRGSMQAIVAVQQPTAEAAGLPPSPGNPLSALADVAANLFISLPDSPQGKPFIDRAEAGSPAALLRAMRLHPGEARLQQLGCTALASLAEMHVLPAEPLATAAVAAMRAFPAEAALQAQGCRTLLHLTTTAPRKRAVCAHS